MKRVLIVFYLLILCLLAKQVAGQTSILVYSENFESGGTGVILNASGNGTNTGNNRWLINDVYAGAPLYPNTPDQNQVVGGTISFAPNSKYLHICDQGSGILNCNYNPTNASDRFVQFGNGFCTLGLANVRMTFFYVCEGSPTASAELFYSINNGPWTPTGNVFQNQMVWQYTIVTNPNFDNKLNVRFGIRWTNDAGSLPGKMAFGIDDIFIAGDFDNFNTQFNVILDSVKPNPICQNFGLTIYYHLTVPICGAGFFEIQLSNAMGSFTSPTSLGIYQCSNQWMNGFLTPVIPSNTPPGTCYKVRIKYYFTDYQLNFYSNQSVCIEIQQCPNTITTLQPVVTMGGDSVCVGSVIDIPFFSTGVFQNNNVYIAELSDSAGNFPPNCNVLGQSPDPNSYDPALGSPPGSVSGQVNENNMPIIDGCGYYIRIRSTNPATIGMVWGPFCIRHCDIETNHKQDIQACISSTQGFDTTVYVNINFYDTSAHYTMPNQFLLEVHESQFFAVVNVGGLGSVTAINDTTINIHIPPVPGLGALGLQPGMYYLRVIATNSNHPYDVLGTLIHLTIGAPADNLYIWQSPPDSILCVGDAVYFYPIPYNAGPPMNSTYVWYLNGSLFSTDPAVGILFTGAGTFNLTVQETNYGCAGPVTPNSVTLHVLGPPTAPILGPAQVCVGDTIYYHTTFQPNVFFEWTMTGGTIVDTSNNELYIIFDTEGIYTLNLLKLNKCGQAVASKNVIVTAYPDPSFTVTSPICSIDNSVINYTGITTPPLIYNWNFDGGTAVPGGNSGGPHNVQWADSGQHQVILTVTKYGCSSKDTMTVVVWQTPTSSFSFTGLCLGDTTKFADSSGGNPVAWYWNYGDGNSDSLISDPEHIYGNPGSYPVQLIVKSPEGCADTLTQNVNIFANPTATFDLPDTACGGQDVTITYTGNAPPGAQYFWTIEQDDGTILPSTGQGPLTLKWNVNGVYTVTLYVKLDSCTSPLYIDSVNVIGCEIRIPNIFTPDHDPGGYNNEFRIEGIKFYPNSTIRIYNRWGNKVFESDNYDCNVDPGTKEKSGMNCWDGEDHADGVYFYVLKLSNGKEYSGIVTLMR